MKVPFQEEIRAKCCHYETHRKEYRPITRLNVTVYTEGAAEENKNTGGEPLTCVRISTERNCDSLYRMFALCLPSMSSAPCQSMPNNVDRRDAEHVLFTSIRRQLSILFRSLVRYSIGIQAYR